ncbi:bifunctional nuclease 2-like isoform X1 [Carex littledalei]|uniref:Bifunctional nuclease 2-like isoform X1 n=1 Tax=Carex littledalei TaxID=544730 RepID=A0A833S1X4_9POAL|nr:bifunctional nuclease 2-like isoform X1 [Carex littledalei]
MATLEGPVLCRPIAHLKITRIPTAIAFAGSHFTKRGSSFWGFTCNYRGIDSVSFGKSIRNRKGLSICCSHSSSDDNGSTAGNFGERDGDYVDCSVMEAVRRESGNVIIKMQDGQNMRCIYNNIQGGSMRDYAPQPTIVLKMEDGSGLLLPIIVWELPSVLLMAAVRDVPLARPTIYEVLKAMTEIMDYAMKRVRVTKSVDNSYYAEIYFAKIGDENDTKVIDCRPSDAINVAVRCKVPIQVNRSIAYSDGVRVIEQTKLAPATLSDGILFTKLDRPDGQPCIEAKEFGLVRNMLIAAVEERYKDAALWRDMLNKLRTKSKKWA